MDLSSAQELSQLRQVQPNTVRTDRLLQGRKKFGDGQPTTAFPGYLSRMELEVFRPEYTDDNKLEILRATVSGEHAEKPAEALEEAALDFAAFYPATDESDYVMRSPVKGPLNDELRLHATVRPHTDHGHTRYLG